MVFQISAVSLLGFSLSLFGLIDEQIVGHVWTMLDVPPQLFYNFQASEIFLGALRASPWILVGFIQPIPGGIHVFLRFRYCEVSASMPYLGASRPQ